MNTNKSVGQMTLAELIAAFKNVFATKEELKDITKNLVTKSELNEAFENVITKDEFRETVASLNRDIREGFNRMDTRFDRLEVDYGPRIAQTENRLLTVKKVIQEDLGAKVAWQ